MKLYEIANDYLALVEAIENEEIPEEAIADTLIWGDRKRRGLFPVERAKAEHIGAGALETHILAYHILNGIAGHQFINKRCRKRHDFLPFL